MKLDPGAKIVLVSGGGWGVGDVEGAVREVLEVKGVDQVVCLCGRNEELRDQLARDFDGDRRVRAEGFTDDMPDWLAAADALVHSTGGLTVLEALMRGCPAISYGWGRGHVQDQQPRVQALRARPGRGHPGCAARRRRDRARVGTHRDRLLGSTVCGLVRPRRGRTASARDGACGLRELSPLLGSARSPSGALLPLRP